MSSMYDVLLDFFLQTHTQEYEHGHIEAAIGKDGKKPACLVLFKGMRYGEIVPFACPLRVAGSPLQGKACELKEVCKYA